MIILSEYIKCVKVVTRAFGRGHFYLYALHLHNSQKEIKECEEYSDFSYMLHPTSDFASHLLSRSGQVKVLEPEWLAKQIRDMAKSICDHYEDLSD